MGRKDLMGVQLHWTKSSIPSGYSSVVSIFFDSVVSWSWREYHISLASFSEGKRVFWNATFYIACVYGITLFTNNVNISVFIGLLKACSSFKIYYCFSKISQDVQYVESATSMDILVVALSICENGQRGLSKCNNVVIWCMLYSKIWLLDQKSNMLKGWWVLRGSLLFTLYFEV